MSGPVVCGVDGSPHSRRAARVAADLAGALGEQLVLVKVVPEVSRVGGLHVEGGREAVVEEEERYGDEVMDEIARDLRGVTAEQRVEFGDPGERLAAFAAEQGAGLLVVGTQGRGAVGSALLGSVSRDAIEHARCPVVVVPDGVRAD